MMNRLDGAKRVKICGIGPVKWRDLLWMAGLIGSTVVLGLIHLGTGTISNGLLALLFPSSPATTPDSYYAVMQVRLPRLLLGWGVGASVALTGALLQSLLRNPLADPGLLGISQGALVAVMMCLVFAPTVPHQYLPMVALAGGLVVGILLLVLTQSPGHGGGQAAIAVLLMGIGLETVLSSIGTMLALYTSPELSAAIGHWMAGSLGLADWSRFWAWLPWACLAPFTILIFGPATRVFDLGDTLAQSLGENTTISRPLILASSVTISAASITAVGPLAFLGVLGPHLSDFLNRAFGRMRLLQAGMTGGLLVVAADLFSRLWARDLAVPLSLSLTLVGVPLFIITLRLSQMQRPRLS